MDEKNRIPLKIYFYHTRTVEQSYEDWKQARFPGHLLYGMPLFDKHGIKSIIHRHKHFEKRWRITLHATKEILTCKEKFDILYGTSFRGLELIVFLRALGLYRKPIVIWHHQAIIRNKNKFRGFLSRIFYRGFDHLFFFSNELINRSIQANKFPAAKMELIHWGPDLAFYDQILQDSKKGSERSGFISTGKENRDVTTLIQAFSETGQELELYISKTCGHINYEKIISGLPHAENIRIHFTEGVIPYVLARKVAEKKFIVICCLETAYTVGLTTLVEALALGMPVICSRNPNFGFDIDREGIGITVPYGDIAGWRNAITYLTEHPEEAAEMGRKARKLAEERFNLEIFSQEIAERLHQL